MKFIKSKDVKLHVQTIREVIKGPWELINLLQPPDGKRLSTLLLHKYRLEAWLH